MSSERVIVYGGSGFLGSHVADTLTARGYAVRIFDRKKSPYLQPGQEMVVGDLLDLEAVKDAAKGCAYVYNFAGLADIGEAKDRPRDTVLMNVLGTVNVLEAAHHAQAKRFVLASSLYVFSESGSFYRVSKQACEKYVEAYHERYGLNYTILRYGSLYGRRASDWNGLHGLLRQALETKTIRYVGHETAMREYIHALDAARLSVQILAEEYRNRHIIITGRETLTVGTLLRMLKEMIPDMKEVHCVEPSDSTMSGHYVLTPYSFNPKLGTKLFATEHIDIGQGILDCLADIHARIHAEQMVQGDLILDEKKA